MKSTLFRTRPLLLACLAVCLPANAHAQVNDPATEGRSAAHPVEHDDPQEDGDAIVVTGHAPVDFGILAATTSIEGDTLVSNARGQIGDILASLPGVSATSFSPGASRPILRGFGGDRVAVLIDGIGSVDASNVSADHAVVFDPLTTDHIDVFHGPAVLLFGGNAIGGAVNALDKRIPRRVPATATGTVIGGYGTAADERSLGGALDVPLADRFVAHVDASWRKSDDLRVGGRVVSDALRSDLLDQASNLRAQGQADEADDLVAQANLTGRIPNSAARTFTFGGGLAFIDQGGDLGVSVQRFDTRYGVPTRPGAGGEEGNVSIDLVQTRADLRGSLKLGGPFESLQVRGAYGDYRHFELEGRDIGTRFDGKGVEFRADLVQARTASGWRGRSGVHYTWRELALEGDEAFVPDYTVEQSGVFTLQSIPVFGIATIDLAGRYERSAITARSAAFARTYDLWSGAAGLSFEPADGLKIGANFVHGARAPAPEEMLSDGLHVATQAYERGDRTLGIEKSDGFEAYAHYDLPGAHFSLTGYATRFDGYIAALPTGETIEGFPVYRYTQVPARYRGFEAAGDVRALEWSGGDLTLEASADYTRAQLSGIGPAPRIPPLRVRGGASVRVGDVRLRGDVEWNDRQERVANLETPVDGFTLVGAGIDWHPWGEDGPLAILLDAENLFDVTARRAASFTRDFVPLAGRDIRISVKLDL